MSKKNTYQSGFTLVEIAIVLIIVTILLGYTLAFFPVQQELKKYRNAETEMENIVNQLVAFAQVNGRLPCPDSDADGLENQTPGANNGCAAWFGDVPARTLGMDGNYSTAGVLLDPWTTPYRYQVTADSSGGDVDGDFVIGGDMRTVGIDNLSPDLAVCNVQPAAHTAATPTDETSCDGGTDVVTGVVAVVLSLGKDKGSSATANSDIQSENRDNSATDTVFVSTTNSDSAGVEYDDLVKWLSPNQLLSKMIEADQLP